MKKFNLAIAITALLIIPFFSEAKTTNRNISITNPSGEAFLGCGGVYGGICISYVHTFKNPQITIGYGALISDVFSGTSITDGSTVSVGSCFRVNANTFNDTDIFWIASPLDADTGIPGNPFDSPNGHWITGANPPAVSCSPQVYVGERRVGLAGREKLYATLSINPPEVSTNTGGSTAGLTDQGGGQYCVTSPGTININVSYQPTTGKFYSRSIPVDVLGNEGSCSGSQELTVIGNYSYNSWDAFWAYSNIRPFTLDVPQQSIPFSFTAVSGNTPPNPPTITGPTTGTAGTHPFTCTGSDPDGDSIRYGFDWDNNGTIDQWVPPTGYVASGTSQTASHTFSTPGTYTVRCLVEDSKGAQSSWTSHTITITTPPPLPTTNLQINGSDGPLEVGRGASLVLTWAAQNATACYAYGAGWGSATPVALTGTTTIPANQSDTYSILCTDGTNNAADAVQVTLSNTLKICQNSCSSGIQRTSFALAQGGSQNLVACFNSFSGCTDPSGNVTSSATWNETNSPTNATTITGTDPKTLTGIAGGVENTNVSYSSQNQTLSVSVTCVPTTDCSNAPGKDNYCQNETFSVDNGCGVSITCNGTKTCDLNWKEVAP